MTVFREISALECLMKIGDTSSITVTQNHHVCKVRIYVQERHDNIVMTVIYV